MSLSHHHKLFTFLLFVLGVSGIIFGIYSVYDSVYGTLRVPSGERASLTDLENQSEEEFVSSILTLQTQDSDDDGLTDYEELYGYGTSPYLKDSDSDGFSDLSELKDGTDPMCHKDQNCGASVSPSESILDELKTQLPSYPATPDGNAGAPSMTPSQGSNTMSGAKLRELLKQSGFPEAELNTLSDEELEKKWNEVTSNR